MAHIKRVLGAWIVIGFVWYHFQFHRLITKHVLDVTASSRPPSPPNILILLVDDWGWGDLHANVADKAKIGVESATPNMDKLASDGIRFTDFHTASSVCTPSRAALLTGRMGLRTDMNTLLGPYNKGGLPLEEVIIPELVKEKNYSTFAFGKWHLGHVGRYHPIERGFDHYFGVPYSLDQGCSDYAGYINPPRKTCASESSSYFVGLPLYREKKIIEQPLDMRTLTDKHVHEFEERISKTKNANSKFFAYFAFNHMHVPLGFNERHVNKTKSVYGDTLRELDESIGRMVRILKDNGMYENTLIWLLGDNGPWETECQYGGAAGPYQGVWQRNNGGGTTGKLEVWEGGHRVPGVVSWPNFIRSNQVSNALVSALDILPTVANLLNIKLPNDRKFDGMNIDLVLEGRTKRAHEVLFHPRSDGKSGNIAAVRYKNYKAVYETGGNYFLDCKQKEAPHRFFDPPLLFNLNDDIGEAHPIDSKLQEYKQVMTEITRLKQNKIDDIKRDKKSKFDASRGDDAQPCCNRKKKHCRC